MSLIDDVQQEKQVLSLIDKIKSTPVAKDTKSNSNMKQLFKVEKSLPEAKLCKSDQKDLKANYREVLKLSLQNIS